MCVMIPSTDTWLLAVSSSLGIHVFFLISPVPKNFPEEKSCPSHQEFPPDKAANPVLLNVSALALRGKDVGVEQSRLIGVNSYVV